MNILSNILANFTEEPIPPPFIPCIERNRLKENYRIETYNIKTYNHVTFGRINQVILGEVNDRLCLLVSDSKGQLDYYQGCLLAEDLLLTNPRTLVQTLKHPLLDQYRESVLIELFKNKNAAILFEIEINDHVYLLNSLKEFGIIPNFQATLHPYSQEPYLTFQIRNNDLEIVKLILEIDPEIEPPSDSFYTTALLHRSEETSAFFLEKMKSTLTFEENLLQKASLGNLSLESHAFTSLNPKLQKQIYRVANFYRHEKLVKKLNKFGLLQKAFSSDRFSVLGHNMDIMTLKEKTFAYFQNLRKQGRLLTELEYKTRYPCFKDPSKMNSLIYDEGNGFVSRFTYSRNFERLIGADYVQKIIRQEGLSYPKVPYTILVLSDDLPSKIPIEITEVKGSLICQIPEEIEALVDVKAELIPYNEEFELYSEKAEQLFKAVQHTGYTDLRPDNILIKRGGAYFVDTELKSFGEASNYHYRNLLWRFPLETAAKNHLEYKITNEENSRRISEPPINATFSWADSLYYTPLRFTFPLKEILKTPV